MIRTAFRTSALVLAALALPTMSSHAATAGDDAWLTSYEKAIAKSKETKKPILADFTGSDWCGWCKKLDAEVFATKEFQDWATKNVVLLQLDFPQKKKLPEDITKQNEELQKQFGIEGFPTIVFIDAEGKELGRTGYEAGGPEKWIPKAEAGMKGGAKPEAAPAAEGAANSKWITSWDEAVKRSKKEKKMILADFTGSDWCGWCKKLKAEVFETPEFQAWADANVILLEVDFPRQTELSADLKKQNDGLQQKYGIQGFPTILFLDAKGSKKGQMGYEAGGPSVWVEKAAKIAGNKKAKAKPTGA